MARRKLSLNLALSSLPWLFTAAFVLRSRPFLKLPYDMWHHLMLIRGWFANGAPYLTMPETRPHEVVWHWVWASIFRVLGLSDVFIWAKVIHCAQFFWTLFCLGYFCNVILKIVVPTTGQKLRQFLSLCGAWMFVLGAGTFSVQYQMSWMLWYSVNYQGVTLPAYFLATAILVRLVTGSDEGRGGRVHWTDFIAVCLLLMVIVIFHPLEASYFLLSSGLLIALFSDRIWLVVRRNRLKAWLLPLSFLGIPVLIYYLPEIGIPLPTSRGFKLMTQPKEFLDQILLTGKQIQDTGIHRGLSSFTELAITGSLILAGILSARCFSFSWQKPLETADRVLLWVSLSAIGFGVAPRTLIPSGFLGVMTVDEQVWRFAFASPWFMGFPLWGCYLLKERKTSVRIGIALAPFVAAFLVSRIFLGGPFNANVASLFRSLELRDRDRVGIQYDRGALARLDELVLAVPEPNNGKKNIFLIRTDLQTYVRAATGVYVLGHRLVAVHRGWYGEWENSYELVEIPAPADIPVDEEMQRAFPSMKL